MEWIRKSKINKEEMQELLKTMADKAEEIEENLDLMSADDRTLFENEKYDRLVDVYMTLKEVGQLVRELLGV